MSAPQSAPRLKIQINGPSGSGKTTVMNALAHYLHAKGFPVTAFDMDDSGEAALQPPFAEPAQLIELGKEFVERCEQIEIESFETES